MPSYANYIPYDHFKVISSEVKECPKCCGNGVINIGRFTFRSRYDCLLVGVYKSEPFLVTTNHVGKNYDHKKTCPMCKGKKTVSERDIEKSEYRNRR